MTGSHTLGSGPADAPTGADAVAGIEPATELIEAFDAALDAWESVRRRADAMAVRQALIEASRALMAAVADRHRVEDTARVYLVLTCQGWAVDPLTFDGSPLQGCCDGPAVAACGHGEELDNECDAVLRAARWVELPTGVELDVLLGQG